MNEDWFKEQLSLKRLSQRKLARHLGLDPSAITLTLKGKRRMQMDEAANIALFLGLPVEEVLKNAGLSLGKNTTNTVRIFGTITFGNQIDIAEDLDHVEAPPMLPADTVALTVSDPENLLYRSLLYFLPENDINPGAIGRLSIAKLRNGKMILARIDAGLRPGLYNLKLNSGFLPPHLPPSRRSHVTSALKRIFTEELPEGEAALLEYPPDGTLRDMQLVAAMPILTIQP